MKSKTLMGLAVASTFGWSAAAFAGTGHEVATPFSPNESGENIVLLKEHQNLGNMASIGSISDHGSGTVEGWVTSESNFTGSGFDHSASLSMDDSFALSDDSLSGMDESLALSDDGVYSDYYIVSWTPVTVETWDVYLIDDTALGEEGFGE